MGETRSIGGSWYMGRSWCMGESRDMGRLLVNVRV